MPKQKRDGVVSSLICRIVDHLRRIRNARRLGIPFYRRAAFRLPSHLRVRGRDVPLAYPSEAGVRTDFVTCLIDDEYGLWGPVDAATRTIVDIGANMGFFCMAARARFPQATIHAYEPNPRVAPYLADNGRSADVVVFTEAVGSARGFVRIEDNSDSNQARTHIADSDTGVQQVSLGDVVERLGGRIDLAKIDCEGAEWDLFSAPAPWIQIREVRMEYHLWGTRKFAEVEDALLRLGFEIHKHHPSGEWGTIWATNRGTA